VTFPHGNATRRPGTESRRRRAARDAKGTGDGKPRLTGARKRVTFRHRLYGQVINEWQLLIERRHAYQRQLNAEAEPKAEKEAENMALIDEQLRGIFVRFSSDWSELLNFYPPSYRKCVRRICQASTAGNPAGSWSPSQKVKFLRIPKSRKSL
jgi:hypothetical protein